jgi:hypothetical protein
MLTIFRYWAFIFFLFILSGCGQPLQDGYEPIEWIHINDSGSGTDPQFIGNWKEYATDPVYIGKDSDGYVHIRGTAYWDGALPGPKSSNIMYLPEEFTPSFSVSIPLCLYDSHNHIRLLGKIIVNSVSTCTVYVGDEANDLAFDVVYFGDTCYYAE